MDRTRLLHSLPGQSGSPALGTPAGHSRPGTLQTRESCMGKEDPQCCVTNNKYYCVHHSWFLETNSALTPHAPTESRAQAASNCREAMLTRLVYDSMNSKIWLHLKMQKLHLKKINSKYHSSGFHPTRQ